MRRRLLDQLHNRLENLFEGLNESSPPTGPLSGDGFDWVAKEPRGWIWEIDAQGRYTWCSDEISSLMGYDPEALEGREFAAVGFLGRDQEHLKALLEARKPLENLQLEAHTEDGRTLTVIMQGMVRTTPNGEQLGYRGVTQVLDIKEKTRLPLAVSLPQSPAEISSIEPPRLAPGWGEAAGFVDEGENFQALDTEEIAVPERSLMADKRLVIPIRTADEVLGVLEFDTEGDRFNEEDLILAEDVAIQLAMALQDVRSLRLTEQALEEMREADRLKSQFLANMSHELRTPLNSIIGFSRVILKGIDGPITETQEQDLNAIYNAGQHLLGLINDILDLSKIEAGKMELAFSDVDLPEIIRGVMSTAVGLVKDKTIELVEDIPDDLPLIQADNIRVRQILLNLVSNAAKFTDQGQIGVSARILHRGARREVVIAVFDTGPGIAADEQAKLFEPFSQVDASATRKTGGTGLGLSITRHLVELHGGRIWVESLPGQGSTFAFTLPVHSITDGDPQNSFRPLLIGIDDNPAILERFAQHFTEQGFQMQNAKNVEEAISIASQSAPTAILLDMNSTSSESWLAVQRLKSEPVTRQAMLLAYMQDVVGGHGAHLDVFDVLMNPTEKEVVRSLLAHLDLYMGVCNRVLILDQEDSAQSLFSQLEDMGCSEVQTRSSAQTGLEAVRDFNPQVAMINPLLGSGDGFAVLEAMQRDDQLQTIPIVLLVEHDLEEEQIKLLRQFSDHLMRRRMDSEGALLEQLLSSLTPFLEIDLGRRAT